MVACPAVLQPKGRDVVTIVIAWPPEPRDGAQHHHCLPGQRNDCFDASTIVAPVFVGLRYSLLFQHHVQCLTKQFRLCSNKTGGSSNRKAHGTDQ